MLSERLNRKNQNFTSSNIQNEILKETSLSILHDTVESIKNDGFHTIMVDERSDVSNKEQAVLCVRWVDQNLFSYEDFFRTVSNGENRCCKYSNIY